MQKKKNKLEFPKNFIERLGKANFDAFMRNPNMVWEWYQYRRKIINESKPNNGHITIAELENYYNVDVVTQNVDNLHGRAGSNTIYELHGNIERRYMIIVEFPSEKYSKNF